MPSELSSINNDCYGHVFPFPHIFWPALSIANCDSQVLIVIYLVEASVLDCAPSLLPNSLQQVRSGYLNEIMLRSRIK